MMAFGLLKKPKYQCLDCKKKENRRLLDKETTRRLYVGYASCKHR